MSADLKGKISVQDVATTAGPLMLYVASEPCWSRYYKDNGKAAFEAMKELNQTLLKRIQNRQT